VAHEPPVLLLDEPTAGLDVESRIELHSLIRELQAKGTAIILATHDMAEAETMADRVAILLGGKLVTIGTPMEITATGAGLTKISLRTEAGTLLSAQPCLPAVEQVLVKQDFVVFFSTDIARTIPTLIAHLETIEDSLVDLRVERPSLEDRFMEITTRGNAQ
jgi:ABC-2 type transport system ATP-binding protein